MLRLRKPFESSLVDIQSVFRLIKAVDFLFYNCELSMVQQNLKSYNRICQDENVEKSCHKASRP